MPRRIVVFLAMTGLLAALAVWAKAEAPSLPGPPGEALRHFAAPRHLDVADLSSLPGTNSSCSTRWRASSTGPCRIYLLWGADEGKRIWLETLHTEFALPVPRGG